MKSKEQIIQLINKLQEKIEDISKKFYQRKDLIAYKELEMLLQQILLFMQEILLYTNQYTNEINQVLSNAMQALQEKDSVLIADILYYDMNEILNRIKLEL